ncbi:MAG: hypothetical protein AAGC96_04370 [Pseudomonadota bacterium]
MSMGRDDLEAALMEAHRLEDGRRIAELYCEAGEQAEAAGQSEQASFYFVHAYVFALQEGMDLADMLHARLKARGREA